MKNKTSITKDDFLELVTTDWCWVAENILGLTLWEKQRDIIKSVQKNKRTAVKACTASSKTHTAALLVLCFLLDAKARGETACVLTTAGSWNHVRTVLWREIRAHHSSSRRINNVFPDGVGGELLQTEFRLDEDRYAIGLSVDDPGNFRGHHADRVLIIVDEASVPDQGLFDVIETMLGNEGCRALYISNPTTSSGAFYEAFHRNRTLYNTITISAIDIPNVRQDKIIVPGLPTKEWVEDCRQLYGEGTPPWEAFVLGEFPTVTDDVVIQLAWCEAAIQREGTPGKHIVSLDIARQGSDASALAYIDGDIIVKIDSWHYPALDKTLGRFKAAWGEFGGMDCIPVTDDTGVGGGVTDFGGNIERMPIIPFRGAEKPRDDVRYSNKITEAYFVLAHDLQMGLVAMADDPELVADLTSRKYKFLPNGKRQLESKSDTKKRLGRSPDKADAVVMGWYMRGSSGTNQIQTGEIGTMAQVYGGI